MSKNYFLIVSFLLCANLNAYTTPQLKQDDILDAYNPFFTAQVKNASLALKESYLYIIIPLLIKTREQAIDTFFEQYDYGEKNFATYFEQKINNVFKADSYLTGVKDTISIMNQLEYSPLNTSMFHKSFTFGHYPFKNGSSIPRLW